MESNTDMTSILGSGDGLTYESVECPDCGFPMKIVSSHYWINEFGLKYFPPKEILLFNFCDKCRIQTPIIDDQRPTSGRSATE